MPTQTETQPLPDAARAAQPEPAAYLCTLCGWIYEEAEGLPEAGVPRGTRWEDVPEDFICPECGQGKEAFEPLEL